MSESITRTSVNSDATGELSASRSAAPGRGSTERLRWCCMRPVRLAGTSFLGAGLVLALAVLA